MQWAVTKEEYLQHRRMVSDQRPIGTVSDGGTIKLSDFMEEIKDFAREWTTTTDFDLRFIVYHDYYGGHEIDISIPFKRWETEQEMDERLAEEEREEEIKRKFEIAELKRLKEKYEHTLP